MITNIVRGRVKMCIAWIVISCLSSINLHAQYDEYRKLQADSLERMLAGNTLTIAEMAATYANLANCYLGIDAGKSVDYARKCIELAVTLDGWAVIANCNGVIGMNFYGISQYDSAMVYYDKAFGSIEQMRNYPKYSEETIDDRLSQLWGNIGNLNNIQGKYHEAVDYYTKALKLFEKYGWKESQANAYYNIGLMYAAMKNWDRAEYNFRKLSNLAQEVENLLFTALAEKGMSMVLFNRGDNDGARDRAGTALDYFSSIPEGKADMAATHALLSQIHLEGFGDEKRAEEHALQALDIADDMNLPREKSQSLGTLSAIHLNRKEWSKAEQRALEALDTDDSEPANTMELYEVLSKTYAYLGNAAKSAEYFDKHNALQVAYSNKNYHSALTEMEVLHETQKKDIRIETLAKERQLYMFLMIAGGGMALLILFLLIYRNRLHRRQKELLATQVALESETAERSRLARDLHDGLGGMLSLVQVNLKDVKGMKVLAQEDAVHFGTALDILQSSIVELRRVAHHMMPEALIKYGLRTSLQDFILAVPGADFHFFGEEKRLDGNLEAVVYRSAHELINNVLKHASATHLDVQLVQETDRVALTVTDNGKGFDTAQKTNGMGLQNIRNRILVYDGQMHIFSDGKSGTEVNIEIPLKG